MTFNEIEALEADLWVFDNDGTLYDDTRIGVVVTKLMDQFFARAHGVEEFEGKLLREKLKDKHGVSSTVVALHREEIPVEKFIRETFLAVDFHTPGICPPTALVELVPHLSGEKVILTNSPSEFAWRVLNTLGLEKEFTMVYGTRELNYFSKPATEAFVPIVSAVQEGKRVVYIDDKTQNLLAVRDAGLVTRLRWNGTGLVRIGGVCEVR